MIKQKLLLHCCCAPCSSSVLEQLSDKYEITLFWYNPCIMPNEEFDHRFGELVRLNKEAGYNYQIINMPYENDKYISLTKNNQNDNEGGDRCKMCMNMRLEKCAQFASKNEFDLFCTTLTVSPHKNSTLINNLGELLSKKYNINYLKSDFKKNNGFLRSIELSKKYNLYRQNYCGCKFN